MKLNGPQYYFTFTIIYLIFSTSCQQVNKPELHNGIWRGALKTLSGTEIPFNFELKDSLDKKILTIINGDERFNATEVIVLSDSLIINIPLFDSEIRAAFNENKLTGKWIKHLADRDVLMDFEATANTAWRIIPSPKATSLNINGRWASIFVNSETKDSTLTVAEFQQDGSKITGTFLSTTGDYRFLEGIIENDSLYLSRFDGGGAYLFTAKISSETEIIGGKLYAGLQTVNSWSAIKNENAQLPDAYILTSLKPGVNKLNFSFPNLEGKQVSINDDTYRNKVVIIQMLGSWCPNCMDETAYLDSFYKKYHSKGVEIIGLAYERTAEFEKAKKRVENLKKRFNISYELLLTGYTNAKDEPIKSLPMLASFKAFPTTFVIDKKGQVRKIHTGFSGPGTGSHYTDFIKEFEGTIDKLLDE
jgi:thiol-disulfide isomerase/thioredoxin